MLRVAAIFLCVTLTSANTGDDQVLIEPDDGLGFSYAQGGDGHGMLDHSAKNSDAANVNGYDYDSENVYYLYTRKNQYDKQRLDPWDIETVRQSNYDPYKKTVIFVHGWNINPVLPLQYIIKQAYLAAEDVNLIVVHWNAHPSKINYFTAVRRTPRNGKAIASFVRWLISEIGAKLAYFHFIGADIGAHAIGIAGRYLGGRVPYITVLDPVEYGFHEDSRMRFNENDGIYTEVIHTNGGQIGYLDQLGKVDFYPNGGMDMPGCWDSSCSHIRASEYFAESLTSNKFKGKRCTSAYMAIQGICYWGDSLTMGGLWPKTGQTGIYYLRTNSRMPFARGDEDNYDTGRQNNN